MKAQPFFQGVDLNNLLSQKALFVPQLANEEDTSYFESRCQLGYVDKPRLTSDRRTGHLLL